MQKARRLTVVAALGLLGVLTGCGPEEEPVFLAQSHGHYLFGYQGCHGEPRPIAGFTLSEGDAVHPGPDVWRVRLAAGPPVSAIELGVLPAGYEATLPYRPLTTERFSFEVKPVNGYPHGIAMQFSDVPEGHVHWSGGTRTGKDLRGVPTSKFAC